MEGYAWLALGILAGVGAWSAIRASDGRLVAAGAGMVLAGTIATVVVYGPTGILYVIATVPVVLFVLYQRDRTSERAGWLG